MRLKKLLPVILPVLLILLCSNFSFRKDPSWRELLNGKDLRGWDTYIGPLYDSVQKKFDGQPVGLNKDPKKVFSIVKEDGKSALRISGENFGGISTKEEFENYHLQLEFKWGKLKWAPRKNDKRDSGILYHAVGPHGADWLFWMRSQEFQVQEGDCGDYWGAGGGIFDAPATMRKEKEYIYDPAAGMVAFGAEKPAGRHCIKRTDSEKPHGQWNTVDIYCHGDTTVHIINNVVTMVLYRSRQLEDGREMLMAKGKIQLQSEGSEIFYRNIRMQPITKIPGNFLGSK